MWKPISKVLSSKEDQESIPFACSEILHEYLSSSIPILNTIIQYHPVSTFKNKSFGSKTMRVYNGQNFRAWKGLTWSCYHSRPLRVYTIGWAISDPQYLRVCLCSGMNSSPRYPKIKYRSTQIKCKNFWAMFAGFIHRRLFAERSVGSSSEAGDLTSIMHDDPKHIRSVIIDPAKVDKPSHPMKKGALRAPWSLDLCPFATPALHSFRAS